MASERYRLLEESFGRFCDEERIKTIISWTRPVAVQICGECGENISKNDHSDFCSVAINNRIAYIGSILRRKNIPSIELVKGEEVRYGKDFGRVRI